MPSRISSPLLPRLALACALVLSAALPASAQSAGLTLQECIDRALDKNFGLKIQSFDTANAAEALALSRADYDPGFFISATKSVNQADNAATTLVGTRSDNLNTRAGVAQKISTGATVELSSSMGRSATNNTFATLNPAYSADLTLAVSQPLLKNAGSTVNRAAINRAKIGVGIANLNYKGRVLQTVKDTESAYYNLVYAREQLKVRRLSLDLAEKLLDENKTRKNTGVATDLDVLQAEVGVETARRNVLLAEQTVSDAEDALLSLIGQFEFGTSLGEVALPSVAAFTPDFEISYKLARDNQPDYVAAQEALKQLEIDVAAAKRNRLPTLDLDGAVGYNTRDSSAERAYDRLPDGDGYSWQVGLSLRVPWGMRSEKARYNSAVNTLRREETRVKQIEQNLMAQVRAAVRAVETNLESVAISRKATELSERQYELEKARFDAGLSTSRRVLEAQDDLETARVAELQARVNLRNAMAELNRLDGSSLSLYRVAL